MPGRATADQALGGSGSDALGRVAAMAHQAHHPDDHRQPRGSVGRNERSPRCVPSARCGADTDRCDVEVVQPDCEPSTGTIKRWSRSLTAPSSQDRFHAGRYSLSKSGVNSTSTNFAQVVVDHGTVIWPNGLDLDPLVLHGDFDPAQRAPSSEPGGATQNSGPNGHERPWSAAPNRRSPARPGGCRYDVALRTYRRSSRPNSDDATCGSEDTRSVSIQPESPSVACAIGVSTVSRNRA